MAESETRIIDAKDHAYRDVAKCCERNNCIGAKSRLNELRKLIAYLQKSDKSDQNQNLQEAV